MTDASPSNRTPLHAAVIQEHKDCIRSLWRWNKPLCEEPDLWGWNSLHYAVKLGMEDVVSDMLAWKKSLVYLPAGSENDWTTAIHIAASEDYEEYDSLVDEPDSDGNTPLHLLSASDNHVRELIYHPRAKKMSFNKQNQTPLDIALSRIVTTEKEKLVRDLCSIGRFGKRHLEVKQKYEYMPLTKDDRDKAKKAYQTAVEGILKVAQIHIVVTTLIMTVTFVAGITLPRGFESDPDSSNQGMAILTRKTAFRASVVSDAIAFTCSVVPIFIYFGMPNVKQKYEYMPLTKDDRDKAKKAYQTAVEGILKVAQIHIVVATLIMTVTFVAGITLPRGFESDHKSSNQGMAILTRKTAFRASVVSDAIAFTCSVVPIFIYFGMPNVSTQLKHKHIEKLCNRTIIFLCLSMLAVVIAFATGMFATLSHSLGLAIVVCFVGCLSILLYYFVII
ncbi:hypothetical protein P3S67_031254 [Capsicum chacoense]